MANINFNKDEIIRSFRAAKKHKKEREEKLRNEWQNMEKIVMKERLA